MLDLQGLHLRAALFRCIREFFHQNDFLEVDTPIRQPLYLPEGNIEPFTSEKEFLQTSPELCMKRLLAAGCGKIFQICPCFRKEERGRLHLEEFKMLEWYRSGADYHQLMADCEHLLRVISYRLHLPKQQWPDNTGSVQCLFGVKLNGSWQRLTVAEAFSQYSPVELDQALKNETFDEILVEYIEPQLGSSTPTFLYDYPVELGSLAKKKTDNPEVVERFELYIQGIELANGFSELTDSAEQRLRFKKDIARIKQRTGRNTTMPEKFLCDLERIDLAAGIAMGLDRLCMMIMNNKRIADSISFSPEDLLE